MLDSIRFSFFNSSFVPHGHCYLWNSSLLWLHAISDGVIAIAYYVIAFALFYFVRQRQDVAFKRLIWLFAAFIVACGTTHILAIWTIWIPLYWLFGVVKAVTAVISFYTALELLPRIPQALVAPSAARLETLNRSLTEEVIERKKAEATIQKFNEELEQQVANRTSELEKAKEFNETLFQQEQAARTELETALKNFQDTAERLNIALSAAQMGSWDWDIEQQQQYWSPQTKIILGFRPDFEEVSYAAWAERVHSEDLPRVTAAIAHAQANKTVFAEEYRVWHPDNSLHWVLVRGRVIFTKGGQPRRMIGVMQETTAAKQAALSLKASESRFRFLFEQAAVGMALLSAAGHWLQVNQKLCDFLGYQPKELIGQSFQSITDPADTSQDDDYYHQLIDGSINSCRFEKRYLHKDGRAMWSAVTVSVERDKGGNVLSFIAVIEDIGQLKQAQIDLQQRAIEMERVSELMMVTNALLERRNSELEQFAYVTSHDLKAPLRAISNLSEWIEEDLGEKLPDENRQQLALLKNRVHRMEALINGLLEYSRTNHRQQQIEKGDVRQVLMQAIELIAPTTAFNISIPEQPLILETNQVALGQVFANLVGNAIKHHDREEGRIEITAEQQGDFIEFAVSDDGPGIEPQYHEKIFMIFQTLKARDEFESTGVGLAIVKKIVETEGGSITLESSLGEGTTFRFLWPAKKAIATVRPNSSTLPHFSK